MESANNGKQNGVQMYKHQIQNESSQDLPSTIQIMQNSQGERIIVHSQPNFQKQKVLQILKDRQQVQKFSNQEQKIPNYSSKNQFFEEEKKGGECQINSFRQNQFGQTFNNSNNGYFMDANQESTEIKNEYLPKYQKPDISKKQICREDMPINTGGSYNLNWIDDQNEYRQILKAEEAFAKGECPIPGMDLQVFREILDEQEYQQIKDHYGVKNKYMKQFPIRIAQKTSKGKLCAICCNPYEEGSKVFFLPCSHHYHVDCVVPWFNKNHKCPTCRYDLNEGDNACQDSTPYESEIHGDPSLFD